MVTMRLLVAAALLALGPSGAWAKGPALASTPIDKVFVYSKLLHPDDAVAQQQVSWLRQAVGDVMGWRLASHIAGSDAVIIIVPHGAGYQSGGGSACSSGNGVLACSGPDGSSIDVMCVDLACNSTYNPGNYLSLVVAVPVAGGKKNAVRMVWRSDRGAGGFVARLNVAPGDSARNQQMAFEQSIWSLCRAAGIGGRRKCSSLTSRSLKRWRKSEASGSDVITLP